MMNVATEGQPGQQLQDHPEPRPCACACAGAGACRRTASSDNYVPAGLQSVIAAWPALPENIKAAILALADAGGVQR